MLKIDKPNLILIVFGGSEDFKIDTDTQEAFKKGIMKAANLTYSWIVTAGINTGVSKLGKAF